MAKTGISQHRWWKESVVYQIYPSSFKDSNGDGWGDVKGITSKLDYLKELGIDIVWTSPIYKSPQADMGYDIADYKAIDPMYGSIEDVDVLISELKKRNMKLMMDLVVNHTSNEHDWFTESRSSKDSQKRSWYIWKPPRGYNPDGTPIPPNNWAQILGDAHSAWHYDEKTKEFYLGLFTPEQPDLNWENPDVRAAVHDVIDFWLARGVAGFRMDVINLISKVQSFPDVPGPLPPGQEYVMGDQFFINGPRLHEFLHAIHDEVLSKYDTITVGEMPGISDINEIIKTVGSNAGELNMIFIFDIVDIDNVPGAPHFKFSFRQINASDISRVISKWQRAMRDHDGWNSVFLSNHDQQRAVSRFVDDSDEYRERGAKLLALMETTLAGTLYIYQGEELGLRNAPETWDPATDYKDIESTNFWKKCQKQFANDPEKLAEYRKILVRKARDNSRTPMQWSAKPNAGFCEEGVTPWMRVNEDYETFNVEAQLEKGSGENGVSVFRFWQDAIKRRKELKDVFVYGDFHVVGETEATKDKIFAYIRHGDESGKWLIVLNFSGEKVKWGIPMEHEVREWVVGNYGEKALGKGFKEIIELEPWEALLGICKE